MPRNPALRLLAPLLLGLALLGPAALRAAAYYVEPAIGDSSDPQLLKTLGDLVRDAVVESGNTVPDRLGPDAYDLKPELYRLGRSKVVVLELWSPGPGPRTLLASERQASRTGVLDEAAGRLVRSVVADRPDRREGEEPLPAGGGIPPRFSFNVGMGPRLLGDLDAPSNAASQTYGLNLGFAWPVAERFTLTLDNDYSWCDLSTGAAYLESFTLGTDYYLGLGPTAAYVGAGVGYGSAGTTLDPSDPSVFGYCGEARVGVEFFRDRAVRLGLELRWAVVFTTEGLVLPSSSGLTVLLRF